MIEIYPYTVPTLIDIPNWPQYILERAYRLVGSNGYIVEKNERSTILSTGEQELTTSQEIEEYTNGIIKNATKTFYRLIPLVNGVANEPIFVNTYISTDICSEVYIDQNFQYKTPRSPLRGKITLQTTAVFVTQMPNNEWDENLCCDTFIMPDTETVRYFGKITFGP